MGTLLHSEASPVVSFLEPEDLKGVPTRLESKTNLSDEVGEQKYSQDQ